MRLPSCAAAQVRWDGRQRDDVAGRGRGRERGAAAGRQRPRRPRQGLAWRAIHARLAPRAGPHLEQVQQAHDVGVLRLVQHMHLRGQRLLQLSVELVRVDFLHGSQLARLLMPRSPHHGEGSGADLCFQLPAPNHACARHAARARLHTGRAGGWAGISSPGVRQARVRGCRRGRHRAARAAPRSRLRVERGPRT